jgi:hypothetical protein
MYISMGAECSVKRAREKVGEHLNKRVGRKVKLRAPKGIPADVWRQAHSEGEVVEEVSIEYMSKLDPGDTWEPAIQAVELKDGCLGLRFIHYRRGRPAPLAMINYDWLMDEFRPLVKRTSVIKGLLERIGGPREGIADPGNLSD